MLCAVLIVSDRCFNNEMEDRAGPVISKFLEGNGFKCGILDIVPDEKEMIKNRLIELCDREKVHLVITSGGTGFAPRDVTPEATKEVIEKEAPGMSLAMLEGSLKVTPLAMLSRPVCGIRGGTLIVNLPGSPKAVAECLGFIKPALGHALQLLKNEFVPVRKTHEAMQAHEPGTPTAPADVMTGCKHNCSHKEELDPELVARRHRESPYPMIEVAEAQKIVLEECQTLAKIRVPLLESVGLILAEDISAREPLPPFPASMKDGYAVVAADGAGKRQVIQDASVCGSSPHLPEVKPGFCMRINTGAPLPDGADAVVMVEYTKVVESSPDGKVELVVDVLKPPKVGTDIRPVGSDIKDGQVVLKKGTVIGPSEVGILATVGTDEVPVYKVPVVAVVSTGNELQDSCATLSEGKIRDSNRPMLMALLKDAGVKVIDGGIAPDSLDSLVATLSSALKSADIVITTGGVSIGEKDLLRYVLTTSFGAKVHFARVNMKPGKPTTFATCNLDGAKKLIFGLPGNPVSAIVTSHLYVVPACRKIMNFPPSSVLPTKLKVELGGNQPIPLDPRPEYHRAFLEWHEEGLCPVAVSTGNQLSSRLLSMHSATVLVILPGATEEKKIAKRGEIYDALIIDKV